MTFESLGLSEPLLRAVKASGYSAPTSIQKQAIPAILEGEDMMAAAQTGTGKTAGFTLPLLQLLAENSSNKSKHPRALVLTPTRELAAQVQENVVTYGKYLPLRSATVFGGVNMNQQITKLKNGVDVLVATPGRLLDLHRQRAVNFSQIEILVLDEADRMLDMGFIHDIKTIMSHLPKQRQNLMFSATFSTAIRQLAKSIMNTPVEIDVAPRNSMVETVSHKIHPVDKARKAELLSRLIRTENWYQILVFSRTKHGADKLVKKLTRDNIHAAAIHGDKSQAQRTRTMKNFKNNRTRVLVATDIAARGIDVDQLSHVINFDLPFVPEDYIHRIGRTGRAGASGHAISLVSADEAGQLHDIEKLIKRKINREEIEDFEPKHVVPESVSTRSNQNKQHKKSGNNNWRGKSQARSSKEQPSRGRSGKPNGSGNRKRNPGNKNRHSGPAATRVV